MLALAVVAFAVAAEPAPRVETLLDDDALDQAVAEVAGQKLEAGPLLAAADKPAGDKPAADKPKTDRPHTSSSSSSGTGNAPQFAEAGAASTPQGKVFGVGLQLGYPTAITVKYMLRPDQGIVAGLGGFTGFDYGAGALSLHVDYLWHPNLLTQGEAYAVTWYIGGGGNIVIFNNPRQRAYLTGVTYYYYPTNIWLAARVPFGINLALTQLPFEIYLEAAPELLLFPSVSFGMGAAIGGRAYF